MAFLGIFDKIKAVGGTLHKVEEGVQTVQALLRGAKAIQTADLFHEGHPTLQTIRAQVDELEDIIENSFKQLLTSAKNSFNLIKEKFLVLKKEIEALTAFVKEQAKGDGK